MKSRLIRNNNAAPWLRWLPRLSPLPYFFLLGLAAADPVSLRVSAAASFVPPSAACTVRSPPGVGVVVAATGLGPRACPFSPRRSGPCSGRSPPSLYAAHDDFNEDFAYMEERNRMKIVRELQEAYYSSPSDRDEDSSSEKLRDDGSIPNLPLWRVGWTELPGRSNVLSVHEGRYTHMFETILRTDEPWYVGHLYLPDGSSSLEGELDDRHRLKSWEEEVRRREEEEDDGITKDRAAVVGTLLRILDFRRMSNGRMLLLVQALDRFVVTKSERELPYSVADVKLFLDKEDQLGRNQADSDPSKNKENIGMSRASARARALKRSLRWQYYECNTASKLPVRNDMRDDLVATDVIGTELKNCMPFLPYSSSVNPLTLAKENEMLSEETVDAGFIGGEGLEERLVDANILHVRSNQIDYCSLSIDEIEERTWLLIDEFVRIRRLQSIPNKLLSLLPRNRRWPSDFVLDNFAKRLCGDDPSFVWLDDTYPPHRRQKLLSYSSHVLIESTLLGTRYRQKLLEVYSAKDRLLENIELFQNVNSDLMNELSR